MRLMSSMNAEVSARWAEPARVSTSRRAPLRMIRRERPVTSATMSLPNRWTIWSRAPGTGESDPSFSMRRSRRGAGLRHVPTRDGFTALDGLAVAIHRPGTEVAVRVGESLIELDREGVSEIVQHILARGD